MWPLFIMHCGTASAIITVIIFIVVVVIAIRLLALRHCYAATCKLQHAPLQLFFEDWVRFCSIPKALLHDHDARFIATFWKALLSSMGMLTMFSGAYHS